ncbi:DNA (cytosine-5-)-methyltransferase, partial [Lactobacillaceae bacterium Melli_B3]
KVLNSKNYGNIPQNRERIYIVGFKDEEVYNSFDFPKPIELETTLNDVIDFGDNVDEKYYYRDGKQTFYNQLEDEVTSQKTVYQWRRQYVRANKSGVIPTLTANMGTGGHNVPLILTDDHQIRKLTPKETFNAQGYPKSFKLPEDVANGQLYKQAGNSVSVPVINRIAENIVSALKENDSMNLDLVPDQKAYVLVYLDINGRFDGTSYATDYFDTEEEAHRFAKEHKLKVLSDDEYFKLIQKDKKDSFYMIEEI